MVELVIIARRFRCEAVLCGRQIFTERFAEGILAPSPRRTTRLDGIVHHLGLALGGRPAAMFAKRLMLPVSSTRESEHTNPCDQLLPAQGHGDVSRHPARPVDDLYAQLVAAWTKIRVP